MDTWLDFFTIQAKKPYFQSLMKFVDEQYKNNIVYPKKEDMFNCFKFTPLKEVKVVIVGQDPYHEPDQAMGLSFSVPSNIKLPPSLKNIYKEIEADLNVVMRNDGDLTYLAKQGVFLINAYLTVIKGKPMSHKSKEYDELLKEVIKLLDSKNQPIVFMLWGNAARKLTKILTNPNHLVLESVHPSPLGANHGGWFGLHQFSKANDYLIKNGVKAIDWQN